MNYLGHLLVSGNHPLVITGNFMADAVKGRDLSAYPEAVQRGIRLHRHIDVYTDNHAITLKGRERLRAHCGKYAGVALDMFYDHVIAAQWSLLSTGTLEDFTQRMYAVLLANEERMPERTKRMLPYLIQGDWLLSYRTIAGIGRALGGLARRVPAGEGLLGAELVLANHVEDYTAECLSFLSDLRIELERDHG